MKKRLKDFERREPLVPFPVRLSQADINTVTEAGYNVSEILRASLKEVAEEIKKKSARSVMKRVTPSGGG